MKKFKALVLPIAIIVLIGMNLAFMQYVNDAKLQAQKVKLDIQVNYAIDAATEELVLNTANLDMDYADFEKLAIEPTVALDAFCTVFLKGYGMSYSKENFTLIKSEFIKAFVVASYDGYYISEQTKINSSGAYDGIFSIKQPYLYVDGENVYALNLGFKDAKLYNGNGIQKVDAPITKDRQKEIINSNVSDDLMATVYRQNEGKMFSTIYVPSDMTSLTRTNPIERVTVMAYVSDIYSGTGSEIESFGIGGSRITNQDHVGCYVRDGLKYYAYVRKLPNSIVLIETFESPMIAAENGYYCDPLYMQ